MLVEELFSTLGLKIDEGAWSRGDKLVGGMKKAVLGLAAAFGIREIAEFVKGVAETADAASKASQKYGLTTEAIQEYGYAAKLSNVSQEELEQGLAFLARGLTQVAEKGAGPAADALHRLGIRSDELKGKSLDQQINVIADAFAKMPDGPKKTAAALDLFSRSGAKLIPLLNGGSAGIAQLRQEARDLGIVVSGQTGKAFEDFNDQQTRISAAWQGIKMSVVTALLPTMKGLVDSILAWVKANKDLIAVGVEGMVKLLIVAVKGAVIAFQGIVAVVKFFQEHAELARATIGALIGVLGVFAAAAIDAWVAASGPIIPIIVAVTAVAFAVQKLIKLFREGGPSMKQVLVSLGAAATAALGAIVIGFGPISAAIAATVAGIALLIAKWDDVKKIADTVFGSIDINKLLPQVAPGGRLPAPTTQDQALGIAANPLAGPSLPTLAAPAGSPTTNTITLSAPITVTGTPGMSPVDIGKAVSDHLQRVVNGAYDAIRGGTR